MKSKIQFILSMIIFGTIGLVLKGVNRNPAELAAIRGFIGCLFLLTIMLFKRQKFDFKAIKKNLFILVLSGVALAVNWIFLFLAYNNTTISNAALSVYFAPVFVLIFSPIVLKEKISPKKVICIIIAMTGMFFVVSTAGGSSSTTGGQNHLLGIIFGLLTAVFYASMMLLNKFIKGVDGVQSTFIQLLTAAVVMAPLALIWGGNSVFRITLTDIPMLLLLCIVHSGLAFFLFISGMQKIKGQTIAALNYVDPLTSLLISALILNEAMTLTQIIGGLMLLGATFATVNNEHMNNDSINESYE
ncbi:MAG: transporter [Clostridiales bacterium GWF2_38_85]|nr:MAG: transporter [Clostridiales bacterium GWF2_38_85]HBL84131.1 EamA family transporter [Clostridiales bacterium]